MRLAFAIIAIAGCESPTQLSSPDAAPAAWTLAAIGEAEVERGEPGVTDFVMRLDAPTQPGDLLVLGVHLDTMSSLTPPFGFSEIATARAVNAANDDMLELWYAPSALPGVTTLSLAATGPMYAAVVWDFNVSGHATLDVGEATSAEVPTTMLASPTIGMADPGEIIVAAATSTSWVNGNGPGLLGFGEDSLAYRDGWSHLVGSFPPGSYYETWTTPAAGTYCASAVAFAVSN
ncbi:MAG TPA: hypothetical protein VGL61_26105 [Kofleriaceae bacterium]